jgi:predicted RNA-binding protein with EMAP domain
MTTLTIDDINQQLANLVTAGDPEFVQAAQYVQQLVQQVQASQLSPQDMAELLKDVQRNMEVIQDAGQLALKEQLNTIINGLFVIAGIVY